MTLSFSEVEQILSGSNKNIDCPVCKIIKQKQFFCEICGNEISYNMYKNHNQRQGNKIGKILNIEGL